MSSCCRHLRKTKCWECIKGQAKRIRHKKSKLTTIWLFFCSLHLNISLSPLYLVWFSPTSLCPSLPLMMPSQCYSVEENISVPDRQWHLCVTHPPVTASMTDESSLEDKSTWISDIESTSNESWAGLGLLSVAERCGSNPWLRVFSLPYKQRGDGNDNGFVERRVVFIYTSIGRIICAKTKPLQRHLPVSSHIMRRLTRKKTTPGLQCCRKTSMKMFQTSDWESTQTRAAHFSLLTEYLSSVQHEQ